MKQQFDDEVLGTIIVRRHHNATGIRFKISPKGQLVATTRPRTALYLIKQAAARSRADILRIVKEYQRHVSYSDGQSIGKSHSLRVIVSDGVSLHGALNDRVITITLSPSMNIASREVQAYIQSYVIQALKKEAKTYLPRRLAHLATRHGYRYTSVRYPHTGTRWGSCTSAGVISLNIALMKLPLELIDYVLIHELCHTQELNHSQAFWTLVEAADPQYSTHRKLLKNFSPAL